ncbi:MAG: hypothetical protein ACK412_04915 [Chloroherpetonaceae bacterium]
MAHPILIDRDELKAIVQEALREALRELKSDMKPLAKESLHELLQEQHRSNFSEKSLSQDQFDTLLNETSARYKNVWKALA